MGRRVRLAGLAGFSAAAVYAALVGIWLGLNQEAEEAVGYTAWLLSLPLLSPIVGLLAGRPWALALVIIPALATAPFWGVGCDGDDVCIGALVLWVLLPLCGLGIGIGVLVRRTWPLARRALPPKARAVSRRARSTLEERHLDER
jgi:MFS family permease